MRNTFYVIGTACVMLFFACACFAQETKSIEATPKVEAFAGYSFARQGSANMHGWNGSVTANVNRWLGITGDVDRNAFYGSSAEWAKFLATDRDPRHQRRFAAQD